jgi:hypothetical protein
VTSLYNEIWEATCVPGPLRDGSARLQSIAMCGGYEKHYSRWQLTKPFIYIKPSDNAFFASKIYAT